MREQSFWDGFWGFMLKGLLALTPFGITWCIWVTASISDLKSNSAVIESRNPATVVQQASVEARLVKIQADLVELKLLVVGHVARETEGR